MVDRVVVGELRSAQLVQRLQLVLDGPDRAGGVLEQVRLLRVLDQLLQEADLVAQRDRSAYLNSGGASRPIRETISRVLADEIERGVDRPRRSGLDAGEEAAVLNEIS